MGRKTAGSEPLILLDDGGISPNSLLNRRAAVAFLNSLGYAITYDGLAQVDFRKVGPNRVILGSGTTREIWYRLHELIDWLEQRLNCTVWHAQRIGRLKLPPGFERICPLEPSDMEDFEAA